MICVSMGLASEVVAAIGQVGGGVRTAPQQLPATVVLQFNEGGGSSKGVVGG